MKPVLHLAGLLLALASSSVSWAQSYPSKAVTLLVPYPAGGLSDVIARKVSVPLASEIKQPAIVENLGGASGSIAAQKALQAPADGYTVFQGSPNELILAPMAIAAIKYKPEDFRLVQRISTAPMAILARKDLPANNADELAAHIKKMAAEGKPVSYASVGVGSFYHLLGEHMSKQLGAAMLHVPYKGGAPAVQDLLGGQVDIFITPYSPSQVAMHKEGKLKFVTSLSNERQPLIPQVPSVTESRALKTFTYKINTGYFVRKDTPQPVVDALHRSLTKVLFDGDLRKTLIGMGQEVSDPLRPEETAKAYNDEIKLYQGIARSIGLKAQ